MIRNYLLIAFRGFLKNKGVTAINLVGLSTGMSICLLLILLVYDQVNYDEFHPNKANIYRILSVEKGASSFFESRATSSPLFKEYLNQKESGIQSITCMSKYFSGEVQSKERVLEFRGFFADPDFFEVFGFDIEAASPSDLSDPFTVLLSAEFAQKLFPDSDPIGKVIQVNSEDEYIVRGVIPEPMGKTHVKFDMLASFSSLHSLIESKRLRSYTYEWENVSMAYNYLVLNSGTNPSYIEDRLNALSDEHMDFPEDHSGYNFELQHLNDITPGKVMSNEISFTLPLIFLAFFLFLGIIVILTATINYSNLAIAQALNRVKEVGIRKVNGAKKGSIVLQFLIESMLINLGALILAIFFYRILIFQFNGLWLFSLLEMEFEDTPWAYLYFVLFSLGLGLITGIGPALYVSRFKVNAALKPGFNPDQGRVRRWYSFSAKKFMTGFQFLLALMLIITITLIQNQTKMLVNSEYGFNEENVLFVDLQGHDPEEVRALYTKQAGVLETALTSHHTAVGQTITEKVRLHPDSAKVGFNYFSVDHNYLDLMDLNLIAGKTLPAIGIEDKVVLNEMGVKALNFENPEDAVGQFINVNDTNRYQIVGVVKDYNYEVLMRDIRPLMLIWDEPEISFLYLKLSGIELGKSKEQMKEVWTSYDSKRDFQGGFLDEEMDAFYAFFGDLTKILMVIAAIAVVITCLGLIGIVDFSTQLRIKEVGVRKVLGAESQNLIWILSREFLVLIGITIVLATPLALFLNSLWINQMANHVDIGLLQALPGIILILVLSLTVILIKSVQASRSNPVLLLRSE